MSNLIVHGYPDPRNFGAIFAHEIYSHLMKRGKVKMQSLYQESFNPILPVEEIRRSSSSDPLVLQYQKDLIEAKDVFILFPLWWGMPPAIIKGWLDRILAPQVAYYWEGEDFMEKDSHPLLMDKTFHLVVTADKQVDIEALKRIWEKDIFAFCGGRLQLFLIDRIRERSDLSVKECLERILL